MAEPFVTFDFQDSGCRSYGVERDGRRWFVKEAVTDAARASLTRAIALHHAVRHPAIVRPARILDGMDGPTLIYPWHAGDVLNAATVDGSDRRALARFQALPVEEVHAALGTILAAHLAVAAAGFIAVDLYDGCFLYDFDARTMRLIDLDEYRPGPFELASERLPGSTRYMAPEEFTRGAPINHRTTVHALGRTLLILLDSPDGFRGTDHHRAVAERAAHPDPGERYESVGALVRAWNEPLTVATTIYGRDMDLRQLTDDVETISRRYAEVFSFDRDDAWFLLKLQEEVGELTQAYLMRSGQARTKGRTPDELEANFRSEIADVLCQLLLLARHHDVDVTAEVERKWLYRLRK